MRILVTGGAGFIGSALIRHLIVNTGHAVVNLDKLCYAANLEALSEISSSERYTFERADVCDKDAIHSILMRHQPDAIIHLAGESHVDRSINDPDIFVTSNVIGTQVLLESTRAYWEALAETGEQTRHDQFRFLYVSTDEVYGCRKNGEWVNEDAPYKPTSPYAGSKAAATHLARTYYFTYRLPVLITYSSNNFGPWQYPEKLIPVTIQSALSEKTIPLYGDGNCIRDWLYVEDHIRALVAVLENGTPGDAYNINGNNEIRNLDLVQLICVKLDQMHPRSDGKSYRELIRFVADRPGHDKRYGIDGGRIRSELGWSPRESFDSGLEKTLAWHLDKFQH